MTAIDVRWLWIMAFVIVASKASASAAPTITDAQWTLNHSVSLANARAAHFDPTTGHVIAGQRDGGPDYLYRILPASGLTKLISQVDHVAGIEIAPDGDIFFSEDFAGVIYRIPAGTKTPQSWVSGFQANDDDPVGLAFAPPGHDSGVLLPGEALEVDRGNSGLDVVYRWSPDVAEGEVAVHSDNGTLVDGVDIAIGPHDVWIADAGDAANGTIYRLLANGSLQALTITAILPHPVGLEVDPLSGDLYVLDAGLDSVVRISPATGDATTVATGFDVGLGSWAGIDFTEDGLQIVVTEDTGIHVLARCNATTSGGDDCTANGVTDVCDIAQGAEADCNANSIPDSCDVGSGSSLDCDGNAVPDECPDCAPVEVVFLMDTSTSMDVEASALCSTINGIVAELSAQNVTLIPHIFGISATPGGAYSCLSNHVIALLGTTVPGSPPANVATLGQCPGGNEVASEDWGRATAVVAGLFPWQSGATRVVVPISDEGAWCGDPSTADDTASVNHAIAVAQGAGVIVSPIVASGASAAVASQAAAMANGTGGTSFSSAAASSDIADGILGIILGACLAQANDCNDNAIDDQCELDSGTASDCNDNGIIDSCDLAAQSSLDCNDNGTPDECDVETSQSADCDGNGVPDECPACPAVQVVFVVDTSTSMDDEAAALCSDLAGIEQVLASRGIMVDSQVLGITESPGGAYGCLTGTVSSAFGTAVPGTPPPSLAVLGACPGGNEIGSEDWGRAVAIAAEHASWQQGAIRVVVPIADEGPWCGNPVTNPGADADSIALAISVARDNAVIVSPLTATGSAAEVLDLAQLLASQTGGTLHSTTDANADIANSIEALVTAACTTASDCDTNGIPDSCDLAEQAVADCDGNEVPDSCDIASGAADVDLDGVLDACSPPVLACAWPCCEASTSPGCGDTAVEACVCSAHPECCNAAWSAACVWAATSECSLSCPRAPACCAGPLYQGGCGSDACEACTCATDSFCCTAAWDADCATFAHDACGAACRCDATPHVACSATPGDINGNGLTNVADALCAILTTLWLSSAGQSSPAPQCVAGVPQRCDKDCNCAVDVADVVLVVSAVLGQPLAQSIDENGDSCPDACE